MLIKKRIIFVMVFMLVFSVHSYAEETWKITSLNWEPYSGDGITTQGNSIQKLRELLRKAGIRLIVEFYPWKRAQMKAEEKEYVGYYPAWPEEVHENFIASPPVDWSEVGIMKQSGITLKFKTIDELFKHYKVGIVRSYVYPSVITDAMEKYPNHVEGARDERTLLKKLSNGRNHVAITDPSVMMYLAEKEGIPNVEPVQTIMKKELVIAFRDGKDNLVRMNVLKKILKNNM